jgi:hypothetical protein
MLMKSILIFSALALINCCSAIAQDSTSVSNNKLRFTSSIGFGQSTFAFNIPAPSKFTTPEFKLGLGIIKPISKFLEVKSGISFGIKIKREPYNKLTPQGYLLVVTSPAFINTDELASKRNHYFLEIPLLFQFNFPHPKLGLRSGVNSRFWQPNNSDVDLLTARPELGILVGAYYRLNYKFNIGLDYYYGLTKMDKSSYTINTSPPFTFIMYNRFLQMNLEYKF